MMEKEKIQIFNYKNSEKRPDFKESRKWSIIITISAIIISIISILLKWYILIFPILIVVMVKNYIQYNNMFKYLSFNAFVIKNNILYKVGTYPKYDVMPNDEEFRMDKHRIYDTFQNWGTVLITRRYLSDKFINRSLKPMANINDHTFVKNLFEKREINSIIYEIEKIYYYEYNDTYNSYDIVCDVKDYYNDKTFKKVELIIKKDFDKDNVLENYIKSNSINEEIYTKKELEEKNVDKVKWKLITEILKILMFIIIALILIIAIAKGLR